jgi:hypothetical protein
VGVGYLRTYDPSYVVRQGTAQVDVPGLGGGQLETRLGVGLGYRIARPWEFLAELGGRAAVLFTGPVYDEGACGCAQPFAGKDSFALSLTLGLSFYQ